MVGVFRAVLAALEGGVGAEVPAGERIALDRPCGHAEVDDGADVGTFDEFLDVERFQRGAGEGVDNLVAVGEEFVQVDGEETGVALVEEGGFVEQAMAERTGTRAEVFEHAGGTESDEGPVLDDLVEVGPPQAYVERAGQRFFPHPVQVDLGDLVMRLLLEAELEQEVPQPGFPAEARMAGDLEEVALHALGEVVLEGEVADVHFPGKPAACGEFLELRGKDAFGFFNDF